MGETTHQHKSLKHQMHLLTMFETFQPTIKFHPCQDQRSDRVTMEHQHLPLGLQGCLPP